MTTTSSFMSAVGGFGGRALGVSIDAMIVPPPGSLDDREERLPFLDDVGGELRRVAGADVPRRVDRSGRDEQDLARLERHRRLALDPVLQRALEDVDDLLARMRVPAERSARGEVDARLDGLASGGAEIVPLELGARDAGLLRPRPA